MRIPRSAFAPAALLAALMVLAGPGLPAGEALAQDAATSGSEATTQGEPVAGLFDGSPMAIESSDPLLNPQGPTDRPLGGVDAGVWVIEYASPTCPHCASFHINTYPALKEQYIDTGKIQFILRPFIRNVLDAAVFMIAACSEDSYHELVAAYFAQQSVWAFSDTPRDALLAVAEEYGIDEERFAACLNDDALFNQLNAMREQALDEFGLTATPTFFVNGKILSGDMAIDAMAAEIDPLL